MVETRNQALRKHMETYLTGEMEYMLFINLVHQSLFEDVSNDVVWSRCISRVAYIMAREYQDPKLTPRFIKPHVFCVGVMYAIFKQFAFNTPGVHFNLKDKTVSVDGNYWAHVKEEHELFRYFRTFGFELYEECHIVYDLKEAGNIILEDIGDSPNYSILIDDCNSTDSDFTNSSSDDTSVG